MGNDWIQNSVKVASELVLENVKALILTKKQVLESYILSFLCFVSMLSSDLLFTSTLY